VIRYASVPRPIFLAALSEPSAPGYEKKRKEKEEKKKKDE
jgi:hypothetical protein